MSYLKPGKKKNKNVSYFSHEYIIANHGDIVSFMAMIIVLGLMFNATAPLAKLFILLQHNATDNAETADASKEATLYTTGRRDLLAVIFYTLIAIVMHAVVQEYVLDKVNRKLHLSKIKHSKVNESGHLALFYAASAAWGVHILMRERLITSLPDLWEGYPHSRMSFWLKFYFIAQISYWVHNFPELYFQRVKKEEAPARMTYSSIYLLCITGAYLMNLNRLAMALMVVHYSVETIYHVSRLLYFFNKTKPAKIGFLIWDVLFVAVRIVSVALAFITFMLGLEKSSQERVSLAEGNFNTRFIRMNCLLLTCLLQGYLMWNFITFHTKRIKEYIGQRSRSPKKTKKTFEKKAKKSAQAADSAEMDDQNELTEADRNYPDLRKRKA